MADTESDTTDDETESTGVEDTIEEQRERVEEVAEDAREAVEEQRERVEEATEDARETIEEQIDDGLDAVNENLIDVLSNVLETRTRTDVYIALRGLGEASADEIAEETGLYPEKVEEVLEGLAEDEIVETDEVGGETFYTAIAPTEFVATLPRRLGDRVSEFFDVDADDDRRVLSAEWVPFRVIVEPTETEDETEIAVE